MKFNTVYLNGSPVSQSCNLRGMRDYARVSKVAIVSTCRDPENNVRGLLYVEYANGATCRASFASYHVMIDFVRNRRTWRGAKITHANEDVGYLSKPGLMTS